MVKVKHIYEFKNRTTKNILNEMKEMKAEGFLYVGHNSNERFQDGYRHYYDKYSIYEEALEQLEKGQKATFEGCSFYHLDTFIESLEKRVQGGEMMTVTLKASRQQMKQIMEYIRQFDTLEVLED